MTSTHEQHHPGRPEPTDLAARLQRRAAQSRARLAAVEALREQHLLIAEHSRRRLEASLLLLDRGRTTAAVLLPDRPRASADQG